MNVKGFYKHQPVLTTEPEIVLGKTKEPLYQVTFGEEILYYTGEQLIDFVTTAVVRNKDISNFKVTRITVE